MTTQEIATRIAELCKKGEFETAQKELFAQDAISIEPEDTPEFAKETKGLDNIFEKGNKFMSMVESVHGIDVSEPLIAGNSFAFVLKMDMTMKGQDRMNMQELCVYTTKDGKVISEQFYM
ncbi:nuclear transport factor 2 family protein [Chitinophaga filiformis]|uniref:SnoaL-like domain-containing protein n=1 Tax=Chitinophaga filiformis TaxID=104663 RepID=UPI001F4167DB|nr:SnoaL-like domain-containing protein [Chitinophaga filiformis]MCF6402438.1 nuclear transport factor 2 family protein [Chitinophaga filiformis]